MKKIIIVLLAAAASFTAANKASAQEKGLWIGGKLGYWHDKTEGVKTDSFSIAPEAATISTRDGRWAWRSVTST